MRSITVEKLDSINDARHFLMMLNAILLGWHKDADEIGIEMIKAACGELYSMTFKYIKALDGIDDNSI
ncbi:Uncharacterised protein [Campylobacter hyointestinalis subsp. hyointestinalis]|uniref:Uncharacterized protein n=1 Tax=Campylobacter hyointestinalis subsp. hyointestinalis TaxID=91352 RepID=A0A0S4S138_CAMHY|nr:hypothetical protein [Campylobacter hyointestinalis]CUU80018.1 Uncharacterised protein [Campylobacter hyointestinalis subsp. hyointestinalis]CUU83426.1 Uncharacterised protein [Campylobacter hyointestinalis subsp. hyointestinalis]